MDSWRLSITSGEVSSSSSTSSATRKQILEHILFIQLLEYDNLFVLIVESMHLI